MRVISINGTNYAATGKIVTNISNQARKEGFEVFTCCKNSKKSKEIYFDNQIYIGYRIERLISEQLAYLTGYDWGFNIFGTLAFIKILKKIKPDLIHLHVIHGTYINVPLLLRYIIKKSIPVMWTFHDPWAFTGSCVEFEHVGCFKFRNECNNCVLKKSYPKSYFFDLSTIMFRSKKRLFSKIKNIIIVTPSFWLANYVKESYFKDKRIEVIHNGIDLNVYKPIKSDFLYKKNITNKYIILGVANGWSESKGLEAFIKLSSLLPNEYQIILVGTSDKIDEMLPSNIISIHKTYNQGELVRIYSAASVLVNPTLDDNFPTINVESLACGTPVITYNTGGSPEAINGKSGMVIEKNNINDLLDAIVKVCEKHMFSEKDCVSRALEFDTNVVSSKYVELYKEVLKS